MQHKAVKLIPTSGVKSIIKTGIVVTMALIPQIIWKLFKSRIVSQRMSQRPIQAKRLDFAKGTAHHQNHGHIRG
jgi:hypothetical protein